MTLVIIVIVCLVAGVGIGIVATLLAIEQRLHAIAAADAAETSEEDENHG